MITLPACLTLKKNKLPTLETKLMKEIDSLKDKLVASEIYQRKANLLFYGLPQKSNENVDQVLREAFVSLGLSREDAKSVSIINLHRLPKRNDTNNAPPAIIAKFVYMADRNRILAAYERKSTRHGNDRNDAPPQPTPRISVRSDLPPALKKQRSTLASKAYRLRKEQNLSTKISVVGTKVILFTKTRNATVWQPFKGDD